MTRNQQIEEHIADLRHRQAESWPKGVSRDINHRLGQTPMS